MKRLGVEVSHFEREGSRWTTAILTEAVSASTHMNDVLRYLGLDVVGGHHTHISRRIRALGIDTSHFAPNGRTGVTKNERRRRTSGELLIEQEPTKARRIQGQRLKRAMLERGIADRCALCGTDPMWHGRSLPLEVDHIDGDWRNNRIENLRILCPNCHSTTETYRGRSKGRRTSTTPSQVVAGGVQ
jgi:hypothetical protein